ncbi:MAG TPA: hypothetical protein VFS47_12045 [Steroidobacteraceae bacterium]|nr:hypothetical protein [Steroidobacteraceae bacterium]
MRRTAIGLFGLLAALPILARSWLDDESVFQHVLTNRESIHKSVLALEENPLHKNADGVRGLLMAHYKDVDYLICGDVLGPLSKSKGLEPVMFQIIIASGDWVESNPDRAGDIDAYTLAGLESGVRTYINLLKVKPKATHKLMDELLALYENGTLNQWNLEHACRPK